MGKLIRSTLLEVLIIGRDFVLAVRKFYDASSKTQFMERDVQTSETVSYCNLTMLEQCQIMLAPTQIESDH